MTESFFVIEFHHNGIDYSGRVSPEKKGPDGLYTSWHVVLNEIFFGYMSQHAGKWECSEWRPAELIKVVGEYIHNHH